MPLRSLLRMGPSRGGGEISRMCFDALLFNVIPICFRGK